MKKGIDPKLITTFKKDQILEIARRSLTSVGAHFVLFILVVIITPMRSDHKVVLTGFGICIFLASVIRLILAKQVVSKYESSPLFWNRMISGFTYISGGLWGALSFMMAGYYPLEWPFMFILVINCGLTAGATSSLGPNYSLSRDFTILALFPIAIWGFLNGSSLGIGVGILCLFSSFMFIRMSKDNYEWYWENILNTDQITQQTKTMKGIIDGIHQGVGGLNDASKDLSGFSGEMNQNAEDMSIKIATVATLAEGVNENSDTIVSLMEQGTGNFSNIASATEEMSSTINDVALSTQKTSDITAQAVEQSQRAVEKMEVLDDSAMAINKITDAIGEISEQINLLALNATIEAARAGEAGKGFAVVATEIKELAIQTSASANEITQQVKDIQQSTKDTSLEMSAIKNIVMDANKRVTSITHAVNEQSNATQEVSKNINELSSGFAEVGAIIGRNDESLKNINDHIHELELSATNVKNGATRVDKNAVKLLNLAADMKKTVEA